MCDLTCTLKEMVVINVSKADDADDDLRARQYSVPSELIEDIDGKKFLCLTRKEVCVRRLLTLQARSHVNTSHADEGITNMGLTDVPDQLVAVRQEAIRLWVAGGAEQATKLGSRFYRSKKYQGALAALGDTVEVRTPAVGDLQPITMTMKSNFRGMSWVEVTNQNLSWLTKAVAIQVSEGGHKGKRARTDGGLHQCQSSDSDDSVSADGADDTTAPEVVPVVPSVDVFSMLPPMPKRSPTPDPPVAKRTGKITSFFSQPAQAR